MDTRARPRAVGRIPFGIFLISQVKHRVKYFLPFVVRCSYCILSPEYRVRYRGERGVSGPVKKLIVRIVLEGAIAFEEASYRFYESILKRATMHRSFDLLKRLLSEELKHRMRIEEAQKRGSFAGIQKSAADGEMRDEEGSGGEDETRDFMPGISQEEMEEFCAQWPDIAPEAASKDILRAALNKEQCGYRMYSRLKNRFAMKSIRALYQMLAREELRHIRWIEGELERYGEDA